MAHSRLPLEQRKQITKQATGEQLEGKSFNMEMTFSGKNAPAKKTFSLKDGETYNINDVPLGVTAVVKETTTGNFDTTYTPSGANTQGVTINQGETPVKVTVKNDYNYGSLAVTKVAKGGDLPEKTFDFEVTFKGTDAPDKMTFSLKNGQTKTINNIPVGVVAIVKETTPADNFDITYSPATANSAGVTITKGSTPAKVTITNEINTGFVKIDKDLTF